MRRMRSRVEVQAGQFISFEAAPTIYGYPAHEYQLQTWTDPHSIIAICAGWQSGKTVILPHWLKREIQRKGPGDYGAFSSTFKLLNRKFLPELKRVFGDVAEFRSGDQQFVFTELGNRIIHGPKWNGDPTLIQLGHAENPDSLESATLKAVAWDECGQRLVPEQSYHTVRSRLMVNRGRMCLASKPYESGWFERLVASKDPSVGVVTFPSWSNPLNPPEDDAYWEQIRCEMPLWRFVMQYEGRFTMPAGLIYDCFDWERNTCEDFDLDRTSLLYPVMDFGKVNTAGLGIAEQGDTLYVFGEYHAGQKRDYPEHVASMKQLTARNAQGRGYQPGCGGNKHGEDGWREAYRRNGLALDEPPEPNIEVQIQAVYSLMKQGRLKFFRCGARQTIEDVKHFSRQVDEDGNITDKIEKESVWHLLAALRYGVSKLARPRPRGTASAPRIAPAQISPIVHVPEQSPLSTVRPRAPIRSGVAVARTSLNRGFPR